MDMYSHSTPSPDVEWGSFGAFTLRNVEGVLFLAIGFVSICSDLSSCIVYFKFTSQCLFVIHGEVHQAPDVLPLRIPDCGVLFVRGILAVVGKNEGVPGIPGVLFKLAGHRYDQTTAQDLPAW